MNRIPYKYIAIEGVIGAGKTVLSQKLSKDFNTSLVLEEFAENPFLAKFYEDPTRYAFQVETFFLIDRQRQLRNLQSQKVFSENIVLADYFIDKCLIFAQNNLQGEEYKLYSSIFEMTSSSLPKPDLILYLKSSVETLLKNINKRGREYEQGIKIDYLENLQEKYLDYLNHYKKAPVILLETSEIDFIEKTEKYSFIQKLIQQDFPLGITRITL